MAWIAFSAPIQDGKTDAYRQWAAELAGARRAEYEEHMRRLGKTREFSFLQRTPAGDVAVVVQEVDDPRAAMERLVSSREPFDVWFKDKIEDIHGFDMSAPPPLPEPTVEVDLTAAR